MMRAYAAVLVTAVLVSAGCDQKPSREPQQSRVEAVPPPAPREGLIPSGERAPNFEATDQTGRRIVLSQLLMDKNVVLIFYPADFTPGCTKQLCNVRDDWSQFESRKTMVLGVNPATVSRHAEFAREYNLEFPVISDTDARIAAGYGAAGKNPEHPNRTVYVIHKDGKVAFAERGMVSHEKIFAALDG
jgi:peroxiredoxin Q/BCP